MAERFGIVGSGREFLRALVLAAARMAGISNRECRHRTAAMAGCDSVCAGFAVALRCVWDFGWTGHGTPAPFIPPQRLVVVGLYRYVRNPMYVGFATGWIGLWIVFGHANAAMLVTVACAALAVHLFVVLYEEPTLRGKFDGDYETYRRNVRRWWPRLRPWSQPKEESGLLRDSVIGS